MGGHGVFFLCFFFFFLRKKNIKVPIKRKKHSRGKIWIVWFSQEKKPWLRSANMDCVRGVHVICFIFSVLYKLTYTATPTHRTRFSALGGSLFLEWTEFKTKTNPNGHKVLTIWVCFGFQLGLRQNQILILIYTMLWSKGLSALYW